MIPEKRKHLRYDFKQLIDYIFDIKTPDVLLKGLVYNISYSGLCIGTNCLIPEGQKITIKSILPSDSQIAVVRWTKKIGDNFFRIGLELLKDSTRCVE